MKTKILLILLLISCLAFAQAPTDEIMRYTFTGGSLINQANPGVGDLVQTGSATTFTADYEGNAGNAVQLNGDSYVGGQTASVDNRTITISFWMKSAAPTSTSNQVLLQVYGSGGRGIRIQQRLSGSNYVFGYNGVGGNNLNRDIVANSIGLYDNQWHHIALRTSEFYPSGDETIPVEMYIDGVRNTTLSDQQFNWASVNFPPFLSNGTVTVAPSGNYQDGIDDIRFYERDLSDTEIAALAEDGMKNIMYVDINASGANDGTSWANAYTDLQNAISNTQTDTDEMWIAKGTYTPDASDRSVYFNFNKANLKIYGSFNGESNPANRDILNNPTILSGDINNSGDLSGNSYHIVRASSDSMIFDGLTITGGNASDSSGFNSYGSALYKSDGVRDLTIRNCNISGNNNYATGALYTKYASNTRGKLKVENTTFELNNARYGSGFYSYLDHNTFVKTDITNCLFSRNTTFQNNTAYSASAAWLRVSGTGSVNRANITNCTFAKNHNKGTQYVNTRGILGISGNSLMSANVSNCVFWDNIDSYGTNNVAVSINGISANLTATVNAFNSIDEDNFSEVPNGNKINTSNADPLFLNADGFDYTLLPGSPALDSGDNSKLPLHITTDLLGGNRIFNTTVDMGCYEIQTTNTYDLTIQPIVGNGTLYPSVGTHTYYEGTNANITSTPDYGWLFDNWSGDASGNTNPLQLLMDADKSLKATFIPVPAVLVDINATGNNDGTSWANAYTDIQTALAGALAIEASEIWVAAGTYLPGSSRNDSFYFNVENLQIYGGFDATETNLSDRDISLINTTNETILSGDLLGNDDATVDFSDTTRTDNSYHVVEVTANNITVDGFTIRDGYADATTGANRFGGGIYKPNSARNFTIKNSVLKNNVALQGAALTLNSPTGDSNITVNGCVFENNLAAVASGIDLHLSGNPGNMYITVANSLFHNNKTSDGGINSGAGASAMRLRAYFASVSLHAIIVNNTFVDNENTGTGANSNFPVVDITRKDGTFGNFTIANNIFWGNIKNGGSIAPSIGKTSNLSPGIFDSSTTNRVVSNNTDEDNFSLVTGTKTATNTTDPNLDGDYKLTSGSPAIDTGNNSLIPSGITTDLLGAARIHNTTVDMGAYEFGSMVLGEESFDFINEFVVYPNPTSSILNIRLSQDVKKATIYNLSGQRLLISKNKSIDVSNLSQGVYLIQVESENGVKQTKRFIKN